MSKKDYIKIAEIIKDNKVGITWTTDFYLRMDNLVCDLILYFEDENPEFDRDIFTEACK